MTHRKKNCVEKAWIVMFAPDLIEYPFVKVSLSGAKLMGRVFYN